MIKYALPLLLSENPVVLFIIQNNNSPSLFLISSLSCLRFLFVHLAFYIHFSLILSRWSPSSYSPLIFTCRLWFTRKRRKKTTHMSCLCCLISFNWFSHRCNCRDDDSHQQFKCIFFKHIKKYQTISNNVLRQGRTGSVTFVYRSAVWKTNRSFQQVLL